MKRDCGDGLLVPIAFAVVSCTGKSDRETVTQHKTQNEYDARVKQVMRVPYSDVRMYAKDRQGYANCILSTFGQNRLTEL